MTPAGKKSKLAVDANCRKITEFVSSQQPEPPPLTGDTNDTDRESVQTVRKRNSRRGRGGEISCRERVRNLSGSSIN